MTENVPLSNDVNNEQLEDQNKLMCFACKRIFRSITGLKNHQRACKFKDNFNHTSNVAEDILQSESIETHCEVETFRKEIEDAYTKMSVWRKEPF